MNQLLIEQKNRAGFKHNTELLILIARLTREAEQTTCFFFHVIELLLFNHFVCIAVYVKTVESVITSIWRTLVNYDIADFGRVVFHHAQSRQFLPCDLPESLFNQGK